GPAPVLGDAGGQRAGLAGGARDRLACVATPSPRGCAPRALVDPGRRRGHTHGRARRLARLGPGADAAAARGGAGGRAARRRLGRAVVVDRKSTPSELQSRENLVCRLLLEKKK